MPRTSSKTSPRTSQPANKIGQLPRSLRESLHKSETPACKEEQHSSSVNWISLRKHRNPQVRYSCSRLGALSLAKALLTPTGLVFCCLLAGCMGGQTPHSHGVLTGGVSGRGKKIVVQYRCGACHVIPGVHGAQGVFGPPLTRMALRSYIGGIYPNNPANMTEWLVSPPAMKPKTAMPDLGLSGQQARDVTAYLETLR